MWMERASEFGSVAGFGVDWPFIDFDAMRRTASRSHLRIGAGVGSYKEPGIVATLGERPGIWIDDDMSDEQMDWARMRTEAGVPTLFLRPDPAEGMTRRHFDRVMAFAEEQLAVPS
jgi:hypothetical protein